MPLEIEIRKKLKFKKLTVFDFNLNSKFSLFNFSNIILRKFENLKINLTLK
jgi:hypothetical protein